MRPSYKRYRLIEYLNYLTHHEHKSLTPINVTINAFELKTDIHISKSTAYRIVKNYIDKQTELLNSQINHEILEIYDN